MATPENLKRVYETYQTSRESLRVTRRLVANEQSRFLKRTALENLSTAQAQEALAVSSQQLDDLAVLAMWATFERFVFNFIQTRVKLADAQQPDSSFLKAFEQRFFDELERWQFSKILDLFKEFASSDLIGQAKQVKQYRDWVAHQNPKSIPPTRVEPYSAFSVLSALMTAIAQANSD